MVVIKKKNKIKLSKMTFNDSNNKAINQYVKVGSYDLLKTIGKGNFSICKLALNRLTNQKVKFNFFSS